MKWVIDIPDGYVKLLPVTLGSIASRIILNAVNAGYQLPEEQFTLEEIAQIQDSLEYLLGAELLPENGYTEEVIAALESALQKTEEILGNKA